jgi:hypothetical protein
MGKRGNSHRGLEWKEELLEGIDRKGEDYCK